MKTLIIPDVHGRDFWRKPCKDLDKWDKVIFLGDYVDPYPGEADKKDVIPTLQDIIALKEVYKDKVILLLGNHDLFYCCKPYSDKLSYWSRHDFDRHDAIEGIFKQHSELFQFAYQIDNFLFTHAGVSSGFAKHLIEYGLHSITAANIIEFFKEEEHQELLSMCSYYRGGPYSFSSIVWADVREHYDNTPNKYIKDLFQIFGHTYCKSYIKTDNFAMLDTGGSWYILEDDKLLDANGNLLRNYDNRD